MINFGKFSVNNGVFFNILIIIILILNIVVLVQIPKETANNASISENTGRRSREIEIAVNRERAEAMGISIWEITDAISNSHVSVPAGTLRTNNGNFYVQTVGEAAQIQNLGDIIIRRQISGANTKVRDVAVINDRFIKYDDELTGNSAADDFELIDRELVVKINESAAAQYGLTAAQIGSFLRVGIDGVKVAVWFDNNDEIDVVVRFAEESISSIEQLRTIKIPTESNTFVPLSAVAELIENNDNSAFKRDLNYDYLTNSPSSERVKRRFYKRRFIDLQ